jgi:hypothetical protein
VCVERKLLIPGAKIEDVTAACQKAFKEMGLKIKQSEKTPDGSTTVMAGEGALVPLILRTLLYPFSVQEFIKAAQRSGVHVIVSPSKDGVVVYSCGLALDERTGKPAKYDEDDVEEITDTLEAIDFENKFLKKLQLVFPGTKEIE